MIRTLSARAGAAAVWRELRAARDSDFARKVAGTLATRGFLIGVGLVTSVLVSRILGPEQKGIYAAATTCAAIGVQFGNLGLHAANTYFVARDRPSLAHLAANSLFVSLVVGGAAALILWTLFWVYPGLAPVQGAALGLALLYFPLALANLLGQNLLIGIQEIRTYNYLEIFTNLGFVLLCGVLILGRWVAVESVLLANIGVVSLTLALTGKSLLPHLAGKLVVSFQLLRESLAYGFKAYLSALFAFLVLRVDLILVKYLLGASATGHYSIAVSMGDILYMLPVVIGTILFPKLCARPDGAPRLHLAAGATAAVAVLLLPLLVLAALLARVAVELLYGPAFLPAARPFLYLLPGIYFLGVETVVVQYLNSTGFPIAVVWIWFFATILNFVANLVLIEPFGLVGAAIASTGTYFFVFVCVLWRVFRHAATRWAATAAGNAA